MSRTICRSTTDALPACSSEVTTALAGVSEDGPPTSSATAPTASHSTTKFGAADAFVTVTPTTAAVASSAASKVAALAA